MATSGGTLYSARKRTFLQKTEESKNCSQGRKPVRGISQALGDANRPRAALWPAGRPQPRTQLSCRHRAWAIPQLQTPQVGAAGRCPSAGGGRAGGAGAAGTGRRGPAEPPVRLQLLRPFSRASQVRTGFLTFPHPVPLQGRPLHARDSSAATHTARGGQVPAAPAPPGAQGWPRACPAPTRGDPPGPSPAPGSQRAVRTSMSGASLLSTGAMAACAGGDSGDRPSARVLGLGVQPSAAPGKEEARGQRRGGGAGRDARGRGRGGQADTPRGGE